MNNNVPLDISMDSISPNQGARRQPSKKKPEPAAETKKNTKSSKNGKNNQENAPENKKNWFESARSNFQSNRTRLGIGITLVIIAVVMTVVLIGFLKTGDLDQSLVESGATLTEMADAPEGVANVGGAFGAKLSHLLFVDGLGISSFILAFYFFYVALALFSVVKINFWKFTFKCIFTAVALSIIIGFFTYNADSVMHWGGNHGRYVNLWLYHISDVIGQFAVSIFLIGMLVVMYFHQLSKAYSNASGALARQREALRRSAESHKEQPVLADLPSEEEPEVPAPVSKAETTTPMDTAGFSIDSINEPEPEQPFAARQKGSVGDIVLSIDDVDEPDQNNFRDSAFHIDDDPEEDILPADPSEPIFNIIRRTEDEEIEDGPNFGELTANDYKPYDIRDELSRYKYPTPELLVDRPVKESIDSTEQEENKKLIVETLKTYGIPISQINATIGPTVTRYEILPAEGVRIAQVRRLEDDIARSLAALGIRIIAPIPGTSNIGIEVPNRDPQTVAMRAVITSKKFRECSMALPMALGKTIDNEIFIADLAKMPHLLVAGGTGQGKSVGLNCIIASLLYKKHPGELKFVLIDPKQLEFSLYDKLDHHFLAKLPDEEDAIVTDPMKALATLSSICVEMDNRYSLLKNAGVRNIGEYNDKFTARRLNPEKGHRFMPYLVVIVDEFADLISTAGKDVLLHIGRIAAKARAAGIHMIIATQRPSTDVINGVIKSNFLGRIAFRVMQRVDSQTILDQPGANRLIGRGDMIFSYNSTMERVQCAFIDTPEVEALCDHINNQIGYPTAYILPEPEREGGNLAPGAVDLTKLDDHFEDCAYFVVQNQTASTSSLQRRFGIGYNKAGKIMDQLEAAGIVGPADGQKPRSVLVDSRMLEDIISTLKNR